MEKKPKLSKEERREKFKKNFKALWSKLMFLLKFGIVLGTLILLDFSGGYKLIIYVIMAYLITLWLEHKETIKEVLLDILVKIFG